VEHLEVVRVNTEESSETRPYRNGLIRLNTPLYQPHRLPSRYRRQSWTERALIAVLMLGLLISLAVALFCAGVVVYVGMRAAEVLLGLLGGR
jgi:hypothetical protein